MILDFGLAHADLGASGLHQEAWCHTSSTAPLPTWPRNRPQGLPVSPASDWYSLGSRCSTRQRSPATLLSGPASPNTDRQAAARSARAPIGAGARCSRRLERAVCRPAPTRSRGAAHGPRCAPPAWGAARAAPKSRSPLRPSQHQRARRWSARAPRSPRVPGGRIRGRGPEGQTVALYIHGPSGVGKVDPGPALPGRADRSRPGRCPRRPVLRAGVGVPLQGGSTVSSML